MEGLERATIRVNAQTKCRAQATKSWPCWNMFVEISSLKYTLYLYLIFLSQRKACSVLLTNDLSFY